MAKQKQVIEINFHVLHTITVGFSMVHMCFLNQACLFFQAILLKNGATTYRKMDMYHSNVLYYTIQADI